MNDSKSTPDPIEIQLTKGYVALVSPEDAELFSQRRWYAAVGKPGTYAARHTSKNGKYRTEFMHRVVLSIVLGRPLTSKEQVDHIDGNGLNNQRNNLRLATPSENAHNRTKDKRNTSGYKGVSWNVQTKKWQAAIAVNRKGRHLGYFDTPEEAHAAYCAAAKKYHGKFARTS